RLQRPDSGESGYGLMPPKGRTPGLLLPARQRLAVGFFVELDSEDPLYSDYSQILIVIAEVVVLATTLLSAQDKKEDKKDTKVKGVLPANWGKLGLTDDQKQKVYKTQAEYKDRSEHSTRGKHPPRARPRC